MAMANMNMIRTNVAALGALNALNAINNKLNVSNTQLATGKRINSAGDDPSGLTLASTLDLRARKIGVALNNIGDASNVLAIAEGGLRNINDILSTLVEKVTQAASDTQGVSERNAILQELQQLGQEIDAVAGQTQFNGTVLLTATTLTFQTGPDGADINVFTLSSAFTSSALGISSLTVGSQALSSTSLGSIAAAITTVQSALQRVGALIERFQSKADNLTTARLNVVSASSRIMDADLAAAQLEASKDQILQRTATSQLAAANSQPSNILSLFR
jgi:flagellin